MIMVSLLKNVLYFCLKVVFAENTSGFQPSHILDDTETKNKNTPYKWSHIASTYCALCCLLILGDDLSGVNREAIIKSMYFMFYRKIMNYTAISHRLTCTAVA